MSSCFLYSSPTYSFKTLLDWDKVFVDIRALADGAGIVGWACYQVILVLYSAYFLMLPYSQGFRLYLLPMSFILLRIGKQPMCNAQRQIHVPSNEET